jgi:hypothetical protein
MDPPPLLDEPERTRGKLARQGLERLDLDLSLGSA